MCVVLVGGGYGSGLFTDVEVCVWVLSLRVTGSDTMNVLLKGAEKYDLNINVFKENVEGWFFIFVLPKRECIFQMMLRIGQWGGHFVGISSSDD